MLSISAVNFAPLAISSAAFKSSSVVGLLPIRLTLALVSMSMRALWFSLSVCVYSLFMKEIVSYNLSLFACTIIERMFFMSNTNQLITDFETMINNADEILAEKLIAADAIFYASSHRKIIQSSLHELLWYQRESVYF